MCIILICLLHNGAYLIVISIWGSLLLHSCSYYSLASSRTKLLFLRAEGKLLRRVQSDVNIQASWWEKMALSKSLKRKVDCKNMAYKEEWKDKYAVILPSFVTAKISWCVLFARKQPTDSFECLSELFKLKALNLSQNQTLLQKRSHTFILKANQDEVIVSNSDGKFR